VNRRKIDAAGDLAQHLGVAPVGLDAPCSNAQAPNQRGRHDSHLMAEAQSKIGDPKRLRAGLEYDAARRLSLEVLAQGNRFELLFLHDLPIGRANADLRFRSAEIDRKMLHGCLLLLRL
jgi:hypothetical protein